MEMLVRLLQFEKHDPSILITLLGIIILLRLLHEANAEIPILFRVFGKVMLFRLLQFSNKWSSTLVIPSGIEMLLRLVHSENADFPILFIPDKEILVNELQP
jgi:hypothetical protein